MKKDHKNIIAEYLRSLSEDDLVFLGTRLSEKLCGDVAEALNFMSINQSMDNMFRSARGGMDLFDMCDRVCDQVFKECRQRGINIRKPQAA